MKSRKTPRAQRYDYTSPWWYFITICTKDREHYFGEIVDGQMKLNKLWQFASTHRWQISDHYPMVDCHEFICMPNHIHGIIIIRDIGTQTLASETIDLSRTYKNTSLQSINTSPQSKQSFIPSSWSLGAIIRGYKIGITKYANHNNITFARQWRYHDHIIRNEDEYNRIKYYIQTNPQNRDNDSLQ